MSGKSIIRKLAMSSAALVSVLAFSPAAALAQSSTQTYRADLTSLNKSGTTGTATVKIIGNKATVIIKTKGASANLAHAQHIHIGGNHVCPTSDNDTNKDGIISSVESEPAVGKIKVSLTTRGDVSAKSALDMNRFPKADKAGNISYTRTFTLPSGVSASGLANGVIEQHGIASLSGDKNKYDGKAKSEMDKNLPLEATVPADCGKLVSTSGGGRGAGAPSATTTQPNSTSAPAGAPATGSGSAAGIENPLLFALGGAALLASGVLLTYRKRTTRVPVKINAKHSKERL